MRRAVKHSGFVFLAALVLGIAIKTNQGIPDNAQVDVFPSHEYWLPHMSRAQIWFQESLHDEAHADIALAMLEEITPATWADIKSGGRYEGFTLPPGWKTNADTYTTGRMRSLAVAAILGDDERWNEDGSWNY